MIKSTATTTVTDLGYQKLLQTVKGMRNSYVTIGVHEDAGSYQSGVSVAKVALWNEFGTTNEDGSVHTPERSFFRSTIDENIGLINSWREEMLLNIATKGWTVQKALEAIGFRLQVLVQNKIKSNIPPAPADATRKHKEREGVANQTLIESTLMLRSVVYKVFIK